MSLYLKYRPKELSEVKGNDSIIETLESMLENLNTCPHVFMFHGETGCGKTTIGRILAARLGCVGMDLSEINSADFRGIDTIRELIKNTQYSPREGRCKVYLIDECFSAGTMIQTPDGEIPIELLKKGDILFSLAGVDKIKSVFVNKVDLNRVMKLKFTNGCELYCSKDHLFFTKKGWVKACLLKNNNVVLSFDRLLMQDINLQKKGETDAKKKKTLLGVQHRIEKKSIKHMLSQMFQSIKRTLSLSKDRMERMFSLQETYSLLFGQTRTIQPQILQQPMCGKIQLYKQPRESFFREIQTGIINTPQGIFTNRSGKITTAGFFQPNENKEPFFQSKKSEQSKRNETNKRDASCVERRTWWERILYLSSSFTFSIFRMEDGSGNQNRKLSWRQLWLSSKLQSRFGKSQSKDSNRSGWEWSQIEKSYLARSEKRTKTEGVRLESSEIYQQGHNDQSFFGIITDKERDQGFVNFYDLEVEKHPSYFADSLAVHNCHKLTGDAQNALLKILEDTPSHVYFILCTTDPQKVIAAVKNRCSEYQVKVLSDDVMRKLLRRVVRAEKERLDDEVYDQIIQDSMGHPRAALQTLEKALAVPSEKRLEVAQQAAAQLSQSIELCRALMDSRSNWKKITTILNGLKDQEPESVRRVVLGYAQAVLLKSDNKRCGLILECFMEPNFTNGFPQLVFNCYQVMQG